MNEPPVNLCFISLSVFNPNFVIADTANLLFGSLAIVFLILLAAVFSGSENAMFSLKQSQIEELTQSEKSANSKAVYFLLKHPKKLLGTILIWNTFVNVAIVMVSSLMIATIFDLEQFPLIGFLIEVIFITFIIVLFGEVVPKMYSVQNNEKVTGWVALPIFYAYKMMQPLVYILENSTSIIDKRVTKRGHILSVNELSHAIDITTDEDSPKQEKSILKGIVNFGNTNVKEIMRQRPDITAIEHETDFFELLNLIDELGYSRLPIYDNNIDKIIGVLSVKDVLPKINEEKNYNWIELIRKPFFVPESKKIDGLLKDFQSKRTHMAIVVDEFGGTSGLITMEDILEEIFGEINDEFDDDETIYSKLDDNTFVFEAKMLLNDVCKLMDVEIEIFDEVRNDSDTLAGLMLELNENMPKQNQEIVFHPFVFIIESVDKRRIKRVKVIIEREANAK